MIQKQRKRNPQRKRTSWMLVAAIICFLLFALLSTLPFMMMLGSSSATQAADDAHDRAARELTERKRQEQWRAADAYNRRLAASGQPVLGKIVDPFTASNSEETSMTKDYMHQLTLPADGVMSIIRYPRLGISLPVRHGTDLATLARGAGHMYGTSLPVGGINTRTVISAHTGLADKVMFDKLDGLGGRAKKGDIFYLTTLGKDLAYKVIDIRVVDPGDFSQLRIVKGKDLATLLTCTPYGVNTQRLLVTGTRVKIPFPAPPVSRTGRDWSWLWWVLGISLVWLVMIAVAVALWRRARPVHHRGKHAA
jgi:sortase A